MKKHIILLFLILSTHFVIAQVDKNAELYKTILSKDSLLFEVGFNTCDIIQFENLLSEDFEFFHDKGGISHKAEFLKNLKNGLCGSPNIYQSRRELVPESTEIYPMYKNNILYGAIQKGNHRFYETISGKKETYASSAKFTHFWILENNVWKLYKSLSFDHQNTDLANQNFSIFENDKAIESWLKEINVPTLGIGIINNGKLQQIKVFGELQKGVSAPYNTIFNVASLTKPVTAIVTLKLVSAGKWNLDEPLYKYWIDPDIAKDKNLKLLTTRHVLTHQTGFSNWRWNNDDRKLRFNFTPGTKHLYSGEGFEYLRKALEKKFKKSLDQLAAELIFEPLKMTDTQFFWDEKTDSTRYATGYNPEGKPYKTIKNNSANAADDLLTTIEDYSNFLISILNKKDLSEQVFHEMTSKSVLLKKDKYFGLGFLIYNLDNENYALSHGGADNGCQTIAFIFPKTNQGLVLFTNVDDGYKVYEKLLIHYFGNDGRKIIDIETK